MSRFAPLPEPPYYAVIFTAQRTDVDAGYGAMADKMVELHYVDHISHESVRQLLKKTNFLSLLFGKQRGRFQTRNRSLFFTGKSNPSEYTVHPYS